jgi:hypothetical protein
VIAANGKIANAPCNVMPVDPQPNNLTAGTWTLASGPNCMFTASFKVKNVLHTVQYATLGKGFTSLSGVGQTTQDSLLINLMKPN